jgi:hypothetical protein
MKRTLNSFDFWIMKLKKGNNPAISCEINLRGLIGENPWSLGLLE